MDTLDLTGSKYRCTDDSQQQYTRIYQINLHWNYLDMHIRTLRQKLGDEGGSCIKTVRGVGYRVIKADA
jgi:DNA-binding response OmpR family regulator